MASKGAFHLNEPPSSQPKFMNNGRVEPWLAGLEAFEIDMIGEVAPPVDIKHFIHNFTRYCPCRDTDPAPFMSVKEISWFKKRNGVQHEFMVIEAEIIHGGIVKPRYFQLERHCHFGSVPKELNATDVVPPEVAKKWDEALMDQVKRRLEQDWAARRKSSFFSSSATTSETSLRSSGTVLSSLPYVADETITRLSDDKQDHEHIASPDQYVYLNTLRFGTSSSPSPSGSRKQQPLFRDICLAASIVSRAQPQYNVILYSCYWYAQMVERLLEIQYHPQTVKSGEYDRWAGSLVVMGKNIPIVVLRGDEVVQELQKFKAHLDGLITDEDRRHADSASSLRAQYTELKAHTTESDARIAELQEALNRSKAETTELRRQLELKSPQGES